MMLKIIMMFVSISFLTGCITTQTYRDDTVFQDNDGVFVTRVSCGSGLLVVNVYKSGEEPDHSGFDALSSTSAGNRATSLLCDGSDYRIKVLPEGHYYIGRYFNGGAAVNVSEADAVKFQVVRNKVNYIGDISIASSSGHTGYSWVTKVRGVQIKANSMMKETLKADEPELLSKFSYIEEIAKR